VYHGYGGKAQVRLWTDEFAEIVHPRDGHTKIFFVMNAYLDESGIHDSAEVCVVAGFFGKIGPWRRLEKAWTHAAKRFEVPLEKVHAKELVTKSGFFHEWTKIKQQDFLAALTKAIEDSGIYPVCCGVSVPDFFSLSEKHRRFLTGGTWNGNRFTSSGSPQKPYFMLFTECTKVVQEYTPLAGRAHFFCGLGRPVEGYAREVFAEWKLRPSSFKKLGMLSFPLASETPHLQAADLFSYSAYKYMLEHKHWDVPPSSTLARLIKNRRNIRDVSFRKAWALKEAVVSAIPNMG